MNVAAHRSSPATVRPTLLLGLAVFMLALVLEESAVSSRAWLWAGNARFFVLVAGGFGARYAGRRLSAGTASLVLALTLGVAVLVLR